MRTRKSSRFMLAFRATVAATVLSACADHVVVPTAMDPGPSGRGDVAMDLAPSSPGWQQQARTLIAANNLSPLAAARVLAALGVAQYRAVLLVDDASGAQVPDHGLGAGGRDAFEARRGAVAGASAQVLKFFFAAAGPALEQRVMEEGNAGPGEMHAQFVIGLERGRGVGDALVQRARTDRFTTPFTGTLPTGAGIWTANGPPAGATFGGVLPYVMASGSQFRPAPPPAFGSSAFLTDLAEVAALALNRTDAQRASALYWNFPGGTYTGVGYWNDVAGTYVAVHGMSERAATRVFALTNAAMMDALIGCWEAKYFYLTLRPSQADPTITLTFGLPNHPSYPSGHSCASGAAAAVLSAVFPDRSAELEGWVEQAGLSRMYAGIHYRFDIDAGRALGIGVGQWALAHEQSLARD